MLTRLHVQGFKNLIDVDVRFGALTCVAGLNGVGKSNLFDAIQFLRNLADRPFIEAAQEVRGGQDPRELFTGGKPSTMRLVAEMVIPREGFDDFGQRASASATFLRYELRLRLVAADDGLGGERIQLEHEELSYIKKRDARSRLGFHQTALWLNSVLVPTRRTTSFIMTEPNNDDGSVVRLQSDRMRGEGKSNRGGGKAFGYDAARLPRTVLSSAQNAEETRTAVLVRQEMRNWRQLQLEPSALRRPDDFQSPDRIDASGAHIPATLYRLAAASHERVEAERVYQTTANRLAELVAGVDSVRVDRDPARRLLRFMLKDRYQLELPASSLSDGTMRFAALAVLEQDPTENGVVCLEEPENGIHPQRVDAILRLLDDIAVDTTTPVGETNPLRQVIVTTHSPLVVGRVRASDLVFARTRGHRANGSRIHGLEVLGMDSTWRTRSTKGRAIDVGKVADFLRGKSDEDTEPGVDTDERVIDRMKQLSLFDFAAE